MSPTRQAAIAGAGIVGICCGLHLQREGYSVTLFDPAGPGEGASSGNAGLIAAGSCLPISMPGMAAQVPGMVRDSLGPLTIRWSYLPKLTPWLTRFLAAGAKERVEAISKAMYALYSRALEDLQPLADEAGAGHMIKQRGRLEIYRSEKNFAKTNYSRGLQQARGLRLEVLDGAAIAEMEPALKGAFAGGIHFPDQGHTVDPLSLARALAHHFQLNGGRILKERVEDFETTAEGVRAVRTGGGLHETDLLVVAAGAFSGELAVRLGSRLPLETERGYHAMLPESGITINRPLISGDHKFAITPMDRGLRLAGTVELAGLKAPPNYARAEKLVQAARTLFGEVGTEDITHWMGFRPSMPDSLPVISRTPTHRNVLFAFGHGHLGLTGAATTGRIIADLATGRKPVIDPAPYSAERFQ